MSSRRRDPRTLVSLLQVAAELGLETQILWTRLRNAGVTIHRTRIGSTHVSAIARDDMARLGEEPDAPSPPPELPRMLERGPRASTDLDPTLDALEDAKRRNRELEARLDELRTDLREQAKARHRQRTTHAERFEQMARTHAKLHRTIQSQQHSLGRLEEELRELESRLELRERIYRNNQRYIDRLEGPGLAEAEPRRSA